VTSFSFELTFDPALFTYGGFRKGHLLANWDELTVTVEGNTLRVESEGSDPLVETGVLVELELHVHESPPHLVSLFTLGEGQLNNAALPVELVNGLVIVVDRIHVDVNKDDVVNAVDVQLVVNAVLGMEVPEGIEPDVDGDGDYDAVDVQLVINGAAAAAANESAISP
jgi:hypothetical protein